MTLPCHPQLAFAGKHVAIGDMKTLRLKLRVQSGTLELTGLEDFVGEEVEVTLVAGTPQPTLQSLAFAQGVKPFDFDRCFGASPGSDDFEAVLADWRRHELPRDLPE
jgi:hypothetical protein